jgi:hypothetical protein
MLPWCPAGRAIGNPLGSAAPRSARLGAGHWRRSQALRRHPRSLASAPALRGAAGASQRTRVRAQRQGGWTLCCPSAQALVFDTSIRWQLGLACLHAGCGTHAYLPCAVPQSRRGATFACTPGAVRSAHGKASPRHRGPALRITRTESRCASLTRDERLMLAPRPRAGAGLRRCEITPGARRPPSAAGWFQLASFVIHSAQRLLHREESPSRGRARRGSRRNEASSSAEHPASLGFAGDVEPAARHRQRSEGGVRFCVLAARAAAGARPLCALQLALWRAAAAQPARGSLALSQQPQRQCSGSAAAAPAQQCRSRGRKRAEPALAALIGARRQSASGGAPLCAGTRLLGQHAAEPPTRPLAPPSLPGGAGAACGADLPATAPALRSS